MNNMIEVKTSELKGSALDYAVSLAAGYEPGLEFSCTLSSPCHFVLKKPPFGHPHHGRGFCPSSAWVDGGPLIEQWGVMFNHCRGMVRAEVLGGVGMGDTYLIAAMRAIVASEIGETVSIPGELLL